MDIQEAFDRGDFLTVADSAPLARTPEEQLLVAIAMLRLGKTATALDVFRELSDLVKRLSKVFLHMGQIHIERNEPETARFCLERYLVFYPDDDEALGLMHEQEEEPAPMVEGDSAELAAVYAAQGHYEKALDIYLNILKKSDDPEILKEARKAQSMHIIKTLEGWVARLRA